MRWHVWGQTGALALFLLACGGAPGTLTQGEEAIEAGKYDEAERLLLQTQGGYLTESEKARVKVALGIVAHRQVSGRTRAAEAQPGWKGYEALAETRLWYRKGGGLPDDPADKEIVGLMVQRAESLWPEVRPFHQKHHYTAADQKAAEVLAPLPKAAAPALRKQRAALRAEARAWHEAQLKGAGPGGTALHAGLANRFGGAHKTTLADLRAQAEVAVQAVAGGGRCTTQEAAVARRALASGARKAQVTVTLSRCGSDARERTASEQYTYTVQVPY